ncbi:hypothetical protein SEA_WATERT_69 [Microbacterium phage WaterT]|nr:hypothetical protein SEA_WATERT_69 [Microbacterium phage WaterT]
MPGDCITIRVFNQCATLNQDFGEGCNSDDKPVARASFSLSATRDSNPDCTSFEEVVSYQLD